MRENKDILLLELVENVWYQFSKSVSGSVGILLYLILKMDKHKKSLPRPEPHVISVRHTWISLSVQCFCMSHTVKIQSSCTMLIILKGRHDLS